MTASVDASVVCANVRDVKELIHQRVRERGGDNVSVVAVTKTRGWDAIDAAHVCGCDAVGENYAQELRDKVQGRELQIPVHFIGAIQTNKIRLVADVVHLWQSVDRESVIDELVKRSPQPPRILIQVNTTGEESKHGCDPRDIESLRAVCDAKGVVVEGFMTMGPTNEDREETRQAFALLRKLVDQHGLHVCSMGMSGDYLMAVDEGSTMVRIGQAIFGARGV
jgi:pyridoxal phosphate enzyme (YggS family)